MWMPSRGLFLLLRWVQGWVLGQLLGLVPGQFLGLVLGSRSH